MNDKMKKEQIQEIVIATVVEQLSLFSTEIQTSDLLIHVHHADSLDLIEIKLALEEEFDIEIPIEEAAEKFHTIDNIVSYLETRGVESKGASVIVGEIPRRARVDQWSLGERAIQDAVDRVEEMGADIRLTQAVILLGEARDKVADFVDNVK